MPDTPLHIAIIPDGNRRWARAHALNPWEGHRKAVENFRTLTDWCREDPRVGTLTVWCFSTENWNRDPKEIAELMAMLENYLKKEADDLVKNGTRLLHAGRTDRIPASLKKILEETVERTKEQTAFTLRFALDYGGKDSIVRAVQKVQDPQAITEESFRQLLDNPNLPDIDLVIRTSGEKRTSNFFLWESTYAEWEFVEKQFPEFTTEDLANAVSHFAKRTRRFGA